MTSEWMIERTAERVIKTLKDKLFPDGRFREYLMSGQMQQIYLTAYNAMGIRLKKDHLISLWRQEYAKSYEICELHREHRKLLDIRRNVSRRIRESLQRIKDYDHRHPAADGVRGYTAGVQQ